MRLLLRGWIAVAVLMCAQMACTAPSVSALEPTATPDAAPEPAELPRFSIRADGDYDNQWFDVIVEGGESVELTASIRNLGNVDAELRTYATNATNPVNGGFSAGTEEDEPTGATLWLGYPSATFTSGPADEHKVDFTVTVPADTPAGFYVAALVVETAQPVAIPGTDTFQQIIRSTISVEITVPGEMTSLFELGRPVVLPTGNHWALDVPIANLGTARLRPHGEMVVSTTDGDVVSTTRVEMGSVYGGSLTSIRIALPGQLPFGDYFLSVHLKDESTGAFASIELVPVTIALPEIVEEPMFTVNEVSVTPNGAPVWYADASATITNDGQAIPTANVTLNVQRDGEDVEGYSLARNQALPQGSTEVGQRYIPADGWQEGTWTFELVVTAVSGGTETVLATISVEDEIVVP